MGTIGVIVVLAIVVGGIWLTIALIRTMVRDGISAEERCNQQAAAHQATRNTTDDPDDLDGMNEGDYHNGPGGYTTGAYETSFYGTIYDRDLDLDEEDEHR